MGEDVSSNGDTPLMLAVKGGEYEVALTLIREHGCQCDPNARYTNGQTLLHIASSIGHVSLAQTLILNADSELNARDIHNDTPLKLAVENEQHEIVLALLSGFKCDPKTKAKLSMMALRRANCNGNLHLIETLVMCRIHDDRNVTPPVFATWRQKYESILALLSESDCKYDPNTRYSGDQTLLHIACSVGHVSIARTLIHDYGTDLDARDVQLNTPLALAVINSNNKVALMLLREFKCDPNTQDDHGISPLHIASNLAWFKFYLNKVRMEMLKMIAILHP